MEVTGKETCSHCIVLNEIVSGGARDNEAALKCLVEALQQVGKLSLEKYL